ncbi:hypothetical protein MKEN_00998400 [Mycena kentingensis (nom. inval.)]|nr:hypothetical protein MKEN_00998400 [Mycena kentingensis (nom. inval.)]
MTLPSELIAAFIDELSDDLETLKRCSLVASPFCSPSQRHIFRAIWLHRANWRHYTVGQQALHRGITTPAGTYRQAEAILTESPHLAAYVKDLTIDLPDSADEDIPLKHIVDTIVSNGGLDRLVVSGLVVRWGDLTPELAHALTGAMKNPSLTHLHLLNLQDFPQDTVQDAMARLTALSVHSTTFSGCKAVGDEDIASGKTTVDDTRDAAPRSISPIRHLVHGSGLADSYNIFNSPRAPAFVNVAKLFLRVASSEIVYAERLLGSVSDTLSDLTLDCGSFSQPIFLPTLPHLRALSLRLFCGVARRIPHGVFQTLATIPDAVASSTTYYPFDLTLLFAIQTLISENPWAEPDAPVPTVVTDLLASTNVHSRFQVLFLEGFHTARATAAAAAFSLSLTRDKGRDRAWEEFSEGMKRIFSGCKVEMEQAEELSYVGRLP